MLTDGSVAEKVLVIPKDRVTLSEHFKAVTIDDTKMLPSGREAPLANNNLYNNSYSAINLLQPNSGELYQQEQNRLGRSV